MQSKTTANAIIIVGLIAGDILTTIYALSLGAVERNPSYAARFAEEGLWWILVYLVFWIGVAVVMKGAVDGFLPSKYNGAVFVVGGPLWLWIGWYAIVNNVAVIYVLMVG